MTTQHLTQVDLSRRWHVSGRTLEKWRVQKKGPPWIKAGRRVLYSIDHVEAYEKAHLQNTSDLHPAGGSLD